MFSAERKELKLSSSKVQERHHYEYQYFLKSRTVCVDKADILKLHQQIFRFDHKETAGTQGSALKVFWIFRLQY